MTARTYNERPTNFDTSSALETAPDSRRGILKQWERLRPTFYCTVCQTMQTVQSVNGIVQASEDATYTCCVLECGHSRDIGVSVQRTKAVTQRMTDEQEQEQKQAEKAAEQEQAELHEIRADLESEQLL